MASYFVPICFLFVVLTIVSSAPSIEPLDCPANEEYYYCKLFRCQRSCDDFKKQTPCLPLAPGCYVPSCECVKGYYRNEEGKCVPEAEC
uniref:TIL domain-containing protein n=1 Tax=Heliothis virescens TaxID=7102 RepID=A0A2A4J6R6_HELVI